MSKKNTASQPELAAAKAPAPALDRKTAVSIAAYRHAGTARTVAFHQPAGDGQVHLFGATGIYVATVATAEAAKNEPKTKPAAPAEAPAA